MANLKTGVGTSRVHAPMLLLYVCASLVMVPIGSVRLVANAANPLTVQEASPCSSKGSTTWTGGRTIASTIGDISVCFWAEDTDSIRDGRPSEALRASRRWVLETDQLGGLRLRMVRNAAGNGQLLWFVNGVERPLDGAAETWRDRLLEVVDASSGILSIRGQVANLRGMIAAAQGEQARLRGEMASLRGQVASMRGQIADIQGQRSAFLGRIASLRAEPQSMQGTIAAERGAIASLVSARPAMTSQAGRIQIDTEIGNHEGRIREVQSQVLSLNSTAKIEAVERELNALGADARIAELRQRIDAFDLPARLTDVERRIQALNVDIEVAGLERQIQDFNADSRVTELESLRSAAGERLRRVVNAIR